MTRTETMTDDLKAKRIGSNPFSNHSSCNADMTFHQGFNHFWSNIGTARLALSRSRSIKSSKSSRSSIRTTSLKDFQGGLPLTLSFLFIVSYSMELLCGGRRGCLPMRGVGFLGGVW